ncbi:hypothetical protein BKA67DRAFT_660042 [Truncatella angustata]|uniref:Uncharacterized protein n=1 Tax=Truncatella angustata TaxID=152316 RepID=A0A9P8ZWY6_9PEZI|nr:uncharacterized protein BKA67DRAFT_660042 [Truncatella angustata]KAH6653417.1 hypothetical protein BKA67DRAFT_660042 [Truncatella angustata]
MDNDFAFEFFDNGADNPRYDTPDYTILDVHTIEPTIGRNESLSGETPSPSIMTFVGRSPSVRTSGRDKFTRVDSHLEGLSDLFNLGKKITLQIELVYKEEVELATAATGSRKTKTKKQSATEAQKAQRAAEAGFWTRVYKHHRCRAKHCKQGPHCWADQQGNHHKLEATDLEQTLEDLKDKMKEGEKEEDIDVGVEIPAKIRDNVLAKSRKRKADRAPGNCRHNKTHVSNQCGSCSESDTFRIAGDRAEKLREYCDWTLAQTQDVSWRAELRVGNKHATDNFLELNSILQFPKVATDVLVRKGVKIGVALQFVSKTNIEKWWRESQAAGHVVL